ncbi:hypothetical protein DFQ28_006607 [Apophysomyces sp. BC1034]|nr:hypothetical protein DFQ30_003379 [Apophysomyces sp. BC1015]KAG0183007.1 hypothetical protein DFQ29_000818 [Apophysomyces sp. BC1021]KAG0194758.1 hypothetical protein DFQ28_006607 [Apophysomyces sp. BC1034]
MMMSLLDRIYPLPIFVLAAVFCGLVVGGCAGFAAEALSSLCIATHPPHRTTRQQQEEVVDRTTSTDLQSKYDETISNPEIQKQEQPPPQRKKIGAFSTKSRSRFITAIRNRRPKITHSYYDSDDSDWTDEDPTD